MRFEALPGLWIPALLYEPDKLKGKAPATLPLFDVAVDLHRFTDTIKQASDEGKTLPVR